MVKHAKRGFLFKGLAGVAIIVAALASAGGGTKVSATPIQTFDIDVQQCIGVSPSPTLSPGNAGTTSTLTCPAEPNLVAGANIVINTEVAVPFGSRLGLPFSYASNAWTPIVQPLGTDTGDVAAYPDLLCDGNVDTLGTTGAHLPFPYTERTTTWTATTGYNGADETYLDDSLPPAAFMARLYRYRADLLNVFVGIEFPLANPTPLNTVILAPAFGSSDISLTLLGGQVSAPSTQLLCLDSPQASAAHFGFVGTEVVKAPAVNGLYPRWTTEVSAPDVKDGSITFVYVMDCKKVGAPAITDVDGDCLSAADETTAGTSDADPDTDGDGLVDGVEVTWGSNPTLKDTDSDGRTDLEEMVGPAAFLTDPTVASTDGADGENDGGLILDDDGDGVPDSLVYTTLAGAVGCETHGDHIRCGYNVVHDTTTGLPYTIPTVAGGANGRGDNCPNESNPGFANWDLDNTAHGDGYGDSCDGDDDADGISDKAEAGFAYEDGGTPGTRQCRTDGDSNDTLAANGAWLANGASGIADATSYPVTPLNPNNPDTDGDGAGDGAECQNSRGIGAADGGVNPNSAASKIRAAAGSTDADGDGLGTLGAQRDQEQTARTENISPNLTPDLDGDGNDGNIDCDSDGDGLPDGVEYLILGTAASAADSDGDGIGDALDTGAALFRKPTCSVIGNSLSSTADITDPAIPGKGSASGLDRWRNNVTTGDPGNIDADKDGRTESIVSGVWVENGACGAFPAASLISGDNLNLAPSTATSWDSDGDGMRDGAECALGTDPLSSASKPTLNACAVFVGAASNAVDVDGDGLGAGNEFCHWGTSDALTDSDGDGVRDCVEANDNDGNSQQNFTGDTINNAKAANSIPNAAAKTGDFDLDGSGVTNFTGDTILSAKMANHVGGICPAPPGP